MKEIVFLVLCCVLFSVPVKASREDEIRASTERFESAMKECLPLHESVTEDEIRSLFEGKGGGSSEANCALACVVKRMEGIEVDSATKNLKTEAMIERLTGAYKDEPKELKKAMGAIESCTQEVTVGDNDCETVAAFVQCMVKVYVDNGNN